MVHLVFDFITTINLMITIKWENISFKVFKVEWSFEKQKWVLCNSVGHILHRIRFCKTNKLDCRKYCRRHTAASIFFWKTTHFEHCTIRLFHKQIRWNALWQKFSQTTRCVFREKNAFGCKNRWELPLHSSILFTSTPNCVCLCMWERVFVDAARQRERFRVFLIWMHTNCILTFVFPFPPLSKIVNEEVLAFFLVCRVMMFSVGSFCKLVEALNHQWQCYVQLQVHWLEKNRF